jgi:hypothetical protein
VGLSDVPAEFRNPAAVMWRNREKHLEYLNAHGWDSDVRDRFNDTWLGGLPPDRRRLRALRLWAADKGIFLPADCPDPAHRPKGA